jgi:hypothetical protein
MSNSVICIFNPSLEKSFSAGLIVLYLVRSLPSALEDQHHVWARLSIFKSVIILIIDGYFFFVLHGKESYSIKVVKKD